MVTLLQTSGPPIIRVLILTDVRLFREGLGSVLAGHADVQVVASAPPSDDVTALLLTHCPDVVLLDAATVRSSELVLRVAGALPRARVVAFAVAEEDEEEVLACAEAGVHGFVARSASVEELLEVLRSAARGELRCPPQVAAVVFRQVAKLATFRSATADAPSLTQRETGIVSLIECGLTNKEIAGQLGIEVATVKNHVHNILEKLRVSRRGEVAIFARSQARWRRVLRTASSTGI